MENKIIIPLNSVEQNQFMVWNCLKKEDLPYFKRLLLDGLPLDAFMLNSMVFFEYKEADIKEVLRIATKSEKDVVQWMKGNFTIDELADILPLYQERLPDDYPTDKDCVRLKLWKTLHKRRCDDLIAKHAPEVAEEMRLYDSLLKTNFAKYAPICLKERWIRTLMSVPEGKKFLIDNGKVDVVLSMYGSAANPDVLNYCLQKGLFEEVYAVAKRYDRPAYYDALLEHGEFAVFVKDHSLYAKFLNKYPDKVDWEVLWKEKNTFLQHQHLKMHARRNKKVPQCREFLWKHSGILGKIRLLLS